MDQEDGTREETAPHEPVGDLLRRMDNTKRLRHQQQGRQSLVVVQQKRFTLQEEQRIRRAGLRAEAMKKVVIARLIHASNDDHANTTIDTDWLYLQGMDKLQDVADALLSIAKHAENLERDLAFDMLKADLQDKEKLTVLFKDDEIIVGW